PSMACEAIPPRGTSPAVPSDRPLVAVSLRGANQSHVRSLHRVVAETGKSAPLAGELWRRWKRHCRATMASSQVTIPLRRVTRRDERASEATNESRNQRRTRGPGRGKVSPSTGASSLQSSDFKVAWRPPSVENVHGPAYGCVPRCVLMLPAVPGLSVSPPPFHLVHLAFRPYKTHTTHCHGGRDSRSFSTLRSDASLFVSRPFSLSRFYFSFSRSIPVCICFCQASKGTHCMPMLCGG
ncbi:hypothetical protein B0J11DRAFT_518078, partial [Dendryphion nanum]